MSVGKMLDYRASKEPFTNALIRLQQDVRGALLSLEQFYDQYLTDLKEAPAQLLRSNTDQVAKCIADYMACAESFIDSLGKKVDECYTEDMGE